LRPDAYRWLRPDYKRFLLPGADPGPLRALIESKANFDPNQPRVPAGNPDGGQWTDEPGWTGGSMSGDTIGIADVDVDALDEFSSARRGGHHLVPRAVYKEKPLPRETRRVFDEATTGRIRLRARSDDDGLLRGHYWDGPNGAHGQYNEAVRDLLDSYMAATGIKWERMTPEQARAFLERIEVSQDPRIRDYLSSIRLLQRIFRLRIGGRGIE
jgi:hypothetical protein